MKVRQMNICNCCYGTGGPVEIDCHNCAGTGYDPHEDNPFAQCHSCYGDGLVEEDTCPKCSGAGEIEDEHDLDQEYSDGDEDSEKSEFHKYE